MAFRRSIASRAKHLYQEQRFSPSFSLISNRHDDDDCKTNPNSTSSPLPKIPSFLENAKFGSFSGSMGFFPDRRYSFSSGLLMNSMNCGSHFSRTMSTAFGGGAADEVEYIGDVADVLADSYLPVAALQHLIDYVHTFTGFNCF